MGNIFKQAYDWIKKGLKAEDKSETLYADLLKISELTCESRLYVAYKEAISSKFDLEVARELTNGECWPEQSSIKDNDGVLYYIVGDMAVIFDCMSVVNVECGPYSTIGDEYKIIDGTTIICDDATGSYGFDACDWWSDVKIIDMPDTLTHIGENGFSEWYKLKQIMMSKSLQYIGKDAFSNCKELVEVVFPKSLKCIDEWAFSWCDNLISITFTNAEIKIKKWAFMWCEKLEKIFIPRGASNRFKAMLSEELHSKLIETDLEQKNESVDCLSECKIQNPFKCKNNWNLDIDIYFRAQKKAKKDEYGVFYLYEYKWLLFATKTGENIGVKKYKLYDGVKLIGKNSFRGMSSVTFVEIPNTVKIIGSGAFMNCCNLSDIIIPDSVVTLGENVFSGCSNLKSVVVGNSVSQIRTSAFENCSQLKSVIIGNSVTIIDNAAFGGCSSLTAIEIPGSVIEIGVSAFCNCKKLQEIIIPKGSRAKFEAMLDKSLHSKLVER